MEMWKKILQFLLCVAGWTMFPLPSSKTTERIIRCGES